MYEIIEKWGLPKDIVSCPDCGKLYGHHNSLVEIDSELCKPCFIKRVKIGNITEEPRYATADNFVAYHITE